MSQSYDSLKRATNTICYFFHGEPEDVVMQRSKQQADQGLEQIAVPVTTDLIINLAFKSIANDVVKSSIKTNDQSEYGPQRSEPQTKEQALQDNHNFNTNNNGYGY